MIFHGKREKKSEILMKNGLKPFENNGFRAIKVIIGANNIAQWASTMGENLVSMIYHNLNLVSTMK